MNPRDLLLESFSIAVKAADPIHVVPQHLPSSPRGRTLVVGAGKAAAAMALAVENSWPADARLDGLVITRYGHKLPTHKIEVIEAGHPIPDKNGEQASRQILSAVKALKSEDLLLCLFSGGGSSLLSLPIDGISLQDLKEVTHQLLRCGASIQEINTVRKHLSAVQGGKLAAACKAPVVALIISDVTGDEATHIASGPCAPDPTTYSDALAVLDHYNLEVSSTVRRILFAGKEQAVNETPKPGSSIFFRVENRIIANAHQSLIAASNYFQGLNITPFILGDTVTGESREIAKSYAALAREIHLYPQLLRAPAVLLSGGETTVTLKGNGRGGRNSEFLLSLLIGLAGQERTYALACDTDGLDGSENNAGALITPDSLIRAQEIGLNAASLLDNNDAYTFFEQLNDLVITGPTYTNVNDYRAVLVL
ncbi:glycerate kinase [Nitrosomonas sp. Nm166]|uniref:glycerate kinase type-2 family protein n=1 Tax=Nitrosomonas sp. Nm166 TaxID=1881054 RepID=UPI0008E399C5|nr:glycerate kinase [Nitrosomonas sp. Nm166]SFD89805.1 hydroxypyruvate reductase [Nitrosomonas sp. Nm166]